MGWTAETIVNLAGELAWPLVVLVVVWKFKDGIKSGISNFLNKSNVTELSVGASGITAKMEATKQASDSVMKRKPSEPLPEGMDADSIKKIHTERSTKYTLELFEKVKNHVGALEVNDSEKIDILSTEVSLLQAALHYTDITTVIFASQYDLFNKYMYPQRVLPLAEIEAYFQEIKKALPDVYEDWNAEKYIAYPLLINMIEKYEEGYRLTNLGTSYVMHVRNNPAHIKYMAQL